MIADASKFSTLASAGASSKLAKSGVAIKRDSCRNMASQKKQQQQQWQPQMSSAAAALPMATISLSFGQVRVFAALVCSGSEHLRPLDHASVVADLVFLKVP